MGAELCSPVALRGDVEFESVRDGGNTLERLVDFVWFAKLVLFERELECSRVCE